MQNLTSKNVSWIFLSLWPPLSTPRPLGMPKNWFKLWKCLWRNFTIGFCIWNCVSVQNWLQKTCFEFFVPFDPPYWPLTSHGLLKTGSSFKNDQKKSWKNLLSDFTYKNVGFRKIWLSKAHFEVFDFWSSTKTSQNILQNLSSRHFLTEEGLTTWKITKLPGPEKIQEAGIFVRLAAPL